MEANTRGERAARSSSWLGRLLRWPLTLAATLVLAYLLLWFLQMLGWAALEGWRFWAMLVMVALVIAAAIVAIGWIRDRVFRRLGRGARATWRGVESALDATALVGGGALLGYGITNGRTVVSICVGLLLAFYLFRRIAGAARSAMKESPAA